MSLCFLQDIYALVIELLQYSTDSSPVKPHQQYIVRASFNFLLCIDDKVAFPSYFCICDFEPISVQGFLNQQ
jgi:hypothetical protein